MAATATTTTTTITITTANAATFPITILDSTKKSRTVAPKPLFRIQIRIQKSLIETFANQKQLDSIETQLRERQIPYRPIQDSKDGKTIIIGPFDKKNNVTATMMIFNHTRFLETFTKMIPVESSKMDKKDEINTTISSDQTKVQTVHFPLTLEAQEHNQAHDQGIVIAFEFSFLFIFYFNFLF